jgi:hypothetical protein
MKNLSLFISTFTFLLCNSIIQGIDQNTPNKNPNFFTIPRKLCKKASGRQKNTFGFYAATTFKNTNHHVDLTKQQRLIEQLQNMNLYIEEQTRIASADDLVSLANSSPAPMQNNID